jgi:hypothetical protein
VAQSGMMKEYILDTTTRSVRIFSWNIQRTSGRNLWCYGVSGRCNKIALQEYPPLMEMFCAARWVVKDALLRYKSKRQFFCMLCSKGHPLALSQEIYRQIESFAGTPFARRTRPLMPLKAIKVYT